MDINGGAFGIIAGGVTNEWNTKKSCFSGESVWLRMDVVVWNKVYRRSFFEENGLRMKPGYRGGEDDIFEKSQKIFNQY